VRLYYVVIGLVARGCSVGGYSDMLGVGRLV
jgi:hypothetical protein